MNLGTVGKWAFIVGLVIAVIAGLLFQAVWVVWVLALLGVVVGLLNISTEETERFLLAAIAFLLSATALGVIPLIGGLIDNILAYVAAFVAGATVVVALVTLFRTAR
jgi:ATP synthase protein I